MDFPFFFTWSQQVAPQYLNLQKVTQHEFILENGDNITDLTSISFQASFGHRPRPIIEAVKNQLDHCSMMPPQAVYEEKIQISKDLIQLIQQGPGKIFYTVSGAESVENAAKMARAFSNKKIIACLRHSYHGATLGALSLTGDWRNLASHTIDDWALRIPHPWDDPHLIATEKLIVQVGAKNIAAFCFETISGINGVLSPPLSWWQGIQRLCDQYNILLILDEVICGFYRTGIPFAFQKYPFLKPDFICLAKAITGGVIPFGAVWANEKVSRYFEEHTLVAGLTNYAHPLGLTALKAVMKMTSTADFEGLLQKNSQILHDFLCEIKKYSFIKSTRQEGLLAAIDFHKEIKLSWDFFIQNLFSLAINKQNSIVLAPALNFNHRLLQERLGALKQVIGMIGQ